MARYKALLFVLALAAVLHGVALSEETEWYPEEWPRGTLLDAGMLDVPGDAVFPVYAAPFEDAARFDCGAGADIAGPVVMLYESPDREWIMIRYASEDGYVGWIRPPSMPAGPWDGLEFFPDCIPVRAKRDVILTDDPLGSRRAQAYAARGDELILLLDLEAPDGREWAYVETAVGGKTAYLFAELSAFEEIPLTWVEDGVLCVREGVTRIGYIRGEETANENGEYLGRTGPALVPGSRSLYDLDYSFLMDADSPITGIRLPSTLRSLECEAIRCFSLEELILPEGCESVPQWAFYACDIGRVVIPASLTEGDGLLVSGGEYCSVGCYSVAEGNPVYSDIGGVLYTADGRTLLSYPNGRANAHYDVPEGTERIGDRAFSDDRGGLPLQTVSLPLGLKSIGDHAFSGCTRLISLTVPLTVKEIAENAFYDCVSLERLSLPEGLTAFKNDGSWACYNDFTYYNGDNGMIAGGYRSPYESRDLPGFLRAADGSGKAALYLKPGDEIPVWAAEDGLYTRMSGYDPDTGRIRLRAYPMWDFLPEYFSANRVYMLYADFRDWVPSTGNCLFDYDSFEPGEGVGDMLRPGTYADSGGEWRCRYDGGSSVICTRDGSEDFHVFIGDLSMGIYRERTGDGRTLGILCAWSPSAAVPLLSADGTPVRYVFSGEQAEIIGEEGDLREVRTGFGTYRVESQFVRVVDQAGTDGVD